MAPLFDYIFAAVGTVLVVASLAMTVRHFKIARAVSYIERFNTPSMIEVRSKVDEWLSSAESDAARLAALEQRPELRVAVLTFLNLFTELGIAYKFRLLNRKVMFEMWDVLVPEYWSKLKFFVQHERDKGRAVGAAFEYLAADLARYASRKK